MKGDDFLSVLKLEAITIAGKISDFDAIVSDYVIGKEIHLENALSALESGEKLLPFSENSSYDTLLKLSEDLIGSAGLSEKNKTAPQMSDNEMFLFLNEIKQKIPNIYNNILPFLDISFLDNKYPKITKIKYPNPQLK